MQARTILIKPASGLCNMRCSYCFYCDESRNRSCQSYGMMSEKTLKNIIKRTLREARGEVCFAFQGGEPTLRGIEFFRKAVEYEQRLNVNRVRITNTLQTNGLNLDPEWCGLFREHDFLLGVSVDGTREIHDRFRLDAAGQGTYDRVTESVRLLEQSGVNYNILTVVTRQAAEQIRDIYRDYKKKGWMYQQYIACLDPLGAERGTETYSLTPETYGEFLIRLFEMWEKDWRRGRAPYIRQFENYVGILLGYPPESCEQSGTCSVQCVAEADGSAFPCDFYVLDEYVVGNYNSCGIGEMVRSGNAVRFVRESLPVPAKCRVCRWYVLCRNGCRRNRVPGGEDGERLNYFCRSYEMFFDRCGERLKEIAGYVRKQR